MSRVVVDAKGHVSLKNRESRPEGHSNGLWGTGEIICFPSVELALRQVFRSNADARGAILHHAMHSNYRNSPNEPKRLLLDARAN